MKRLFLLLILLWSIVCTCSSCTLHLGDVNIQLPWWLMTVLIVIPSLLITGFVTWCNVSDDAKTFYVCEHCHHRFKPGWRVLYSPHFGNDYIFKCPFCNKRASCSPSYNQDD